MAAAEDEGFSDGARVRRARRERGVVHVAVEEVRVAVAGRGDGRELRVEEELRRGFSGGGSGGGVVVGEVVYGGADRRELVDQVVRDLVVARDGGGGGGGFVLDGG